MKKKSFLTIFIMLLIMLLILYPNLCLKAAQDGLLLWFNKVLPSLLPFIIFINLLVPLDGLKGLIKLASPLSQKIWHLPGYSFFAFLIGLIASYPMGAKTVKNLYQDGKLNKQDAEITLCFCNNCGPLFIIATVGSAMFGSTSLGYFLLFIHIFSALLLSLFVTRSHQSTIVTDTYLTSNSTTCPSFTTILNNGVMNAMDTILCVGGYIILFSVMLTLLTKTPFLTSLTSHLIKSPNATTYINGIVAVLLEVSNGAHALSKFTPPSIYSIALVSSAIGFGGLCVYFQTLYVLENKLPTTCYFISKCVQGIISFALTLFFYPFYIMYTQKTILYFKSIWLLIGLILLISSYLILHYTLHKNTSAHSTCSFS